METPNTPNTMEPMQLIATPKQVLDTIAPDGLGTWSRKSPAQLLSENEGAQVYTYAQWEAQHDAAWTTPPVEITEERFWDALECLPPEAWKTTAAGETFRLMEYTSGNVTAHYIRKGEKFYSTTRPRTDHTALLALVP